MLLCVRGIKMKTPGKPNVVVQAYNSSICETEKGASGVQDLPKLHSEMLSQKKKKTQPTELTNRDPPWDRQSPVT